VAKLRDRREAALYLARPGRLAVVIDDLAELCGPTSGVVELPHRLMWHPNRQFDLDDPAFLQWMYEIVLCESIRREELRTWLDGPTLIRLWRSLYLPSGVRRAWEERHQSLRLAE